MKDVRIIGIMITDRIKEAGQTQEVLTKFAHVIQSRLGFHEVSDKICSRVGFILLHLSGKPDECDKLDNALHEIRGIEIQKMVFNP